MILIDIFLFLLSVAVGMCLFFGLLMWGESVCARTINGCRGVPGRNVTNRGYSILVGSMQRLHPGKTEGIFTPFCDRDKMKHHMVYDICGEESARNGVCSFIAMCHKAGIEIVIRPVNHDVQDIEENPEEMRKKLRVLRKMYWRYHRSR